MTAQDFTEASRLGKGNSRASVGRGEVLHLLNKHEVMVQVLVLLAETLCAPEL